jgi:Helix-turn-helix domain
MSIKVMNLVWDRYPEGGSELLLILALADHADDAGDRVYPSVQTMARKTRMSERAVQYLLRRIQERGLLVLVEPGGGRNRTARYRINIDRIENGANIAPITKGCNLKPVEPSVTTTTTVVVVTGIEWPSLPAAHQQLAEKVLTECPVGLRQSVIDEWAAAIKDGKIQRSSPIPYLRRLVECAAMGSFTPDAGIAIAARRTGGGSDAAHKARIAAAERAMDERFKRLVAERGAEPDHPVFADGRKTLR